VSAKKGGNLHGSIQKGDKTSHLLEARGKQEFNLLLCSTLNEPHLWWIGPLRPETTRKREKRREQIVQAKKVSDRGLLC